MRTGQRRMILGGALGSLLLGGLTACGDTTTQTTPPPATPASAANTITLSEMKVAMATSYPLGKRTFTITNSGMIPHELLVFRSALTPDKYPVQASGAIAEEGPGITKISDGENLAKGESQNREVDLGQPGAYLFICNLPGHFAAHMYAVATIGP